MRPLAPYWPSIMFLSTSPSSSTMPWSLFVWLHAGPSSVRSACDALLGQVTCAHYCACTTSTSRSSSDRSDIHTNHRAYALAKLCTAHNELCLKTSLAGFDRLAKQPIHILLSVRKTIAVGSADFWIRFSPGANVG